MKRSNKALYEQIMMNVSKQVKRALNESLGTKLYILASIGYPTNEFDTSGLIMEYISAERFHIFSTHEKALDEYMTNKNFSNETLADFVTDTIYLGLDADSDDFEETEIIKYKGKKVEVVQNAGLPSVDEAADIEDYIYTTGGLAIFEVNLD